MSGAYERMIRKKRTYPTRYCPHCKEDVASSTYYNHKKKYYDAKSGQWQGEDPNLFPSQEDSFSTDSDIDFNGR